MIQDNNFKTFSVFVTGSAGFIGANLVKRLLETVDGVTIVGLDNMNYYYDPSLKKYRIAEIERLAAQKHGARWEFVQGSIADRELVERLFEKYRFSVVVNLAAQAGVRYSITNPDVYMESNVIGFYNILETWCMHPVPVSTVPMRRFPIPRMTKQISLSAFMLRRKNPMS